MSYPVQPPPVQPQRPLARFTPTQIALGAVIAVIVALAVGCLMGAAIVVGRDKGTTADAPPPGPAGTDAPVDGRTPPRPTPRPTAVALPDLVGQNALIAHDQLVALGFTNVNYASADEDDTFVIFAQNWHVTKVEPAPGTVLAFDSTIVLTCTKQAP